MSAAQATGARDVVLHAIRISPGVLYLDLCETMADLGLSDAQVHDELRELVAGGEVLGVRCLHGWRYRVAASAEAPLKDGVDIDAVHHDPRWAS